MAESWFPTSRCIVGTVRTLRADWPLARARPCVDEEEIEDAPTKLSDLVVGVTGEGFQDVPVDFLVREAPLERFSNRSRTVVRGFCFLRAVYLLVNLVHQMDQEVLDSVELQNLPGHLIVTREAGSDVGDVVSGSAVM